MGRLTYEGDIYRDECPIVDFSASLTRREAVNYRDQRAIY